MGTIDELNKTVKNVNEIADSPNGAWKILVFTLLCVLGMLMFLGIKTIEKSDRIVVGLEKVLENQNKSSAILANLTNAMNRFNENLRIKEELDEIKNYRRGGK